MNLNRPRHGELIAFLAALALLIAMFFPWHGDRTAWAFDPVGDAFQLLAIAAAFMLTLTTLAYRTPAVPLAFSVWTVVGGVAGLAAVIQRIVASPTPGTAAWIGLAASVLIVAGGWESMRDESPPASLVESKAG